jgi:hypothetical protein
MSFFQIVGAELAVIILLLSTLTQNKSVAAAGYFIGIIFLGMSFISNTGL